MRPAKARKEKTEAELRKLGIPINAWLPVIETEEETTLQDAKDVARRAFVLYAVAHVGYGGDRKHVRKHLEAQGLWEFVSAREKALLDKANPSRQELIDASWRAEALWVVLWALAKLKELNLPTYMCDTDRIQEVMPPKSEIARFIETANLRSVSEILDETDKIYRLHWAVRDAQLKGKVIPAALDPGVVDERHYALNWLTSYADEWDEITTDT